LLGSGPALRRERLRGLCASATRVSRVELDECTRLDEGNPQELGRAHRAG
jgi:hypothetical protein